MNKKKKERKGKKQKEYLLVTLCSHSLKLIGAFTGGGRRWLPSGLPVEHPLPVVAGFPHPHGHGRRRIILMRQYDDVAVERPAGGRPREDEQQHDDDEADETAAAAAHH